jgi:hypothetical protein
MLSQTFISSVNWLFLSVTFENERIAIENPKGQSRMDNREALANWALKTQDEDKPKINTKQHRKHSMATCTT